MKVFYQGLILFFLTMALFFFESCSKLDTEQNFVGRWKFVNVTHISDSSYNEEWEFKPNGDLYIYYPAQRWINDTAITRSVGNFKVKSYKKVAISNLEGNRFILYNSTWEIVLNKKDALRIVNGDHGGLLFKEFVRK